MSNLRLVVLGCRGLVLSPTIIALACAASASGQVISGITATNLTDTSAVISWTTNIPASSLVNYGVTISYGSTMALNPAVVTHAVTLNGLTANTLYNFDVVSTASGNTTISANFRFATLPTSPIFTGINIIYLTSSGATINWTTDQPSTGMVRYGTTTSYSSSTPVVATPTLAHTVTVSGLASSTAYNFAVVSTGVANVPATSANQSFTTPPANSPAPNAGFVGAYGFTDSSAILSWSTDVPATTLVAYGTTPALGQLTPVQPSLTANHGVTLTGLSRGTTYYFVAISTNASGVPGYSLMSNFTTTGQPSLVPVISNVAASGLTTTSATLTWTTNVPSTTLVNYGTTTAYGSSSLLDSTLTSSHSVTLTGLSPNTRYDFQLVSASPTGVLILGTDTTGLAVWAWGDSLTVGYGDLTNHDYPQYLSDAIGVTVANEGLGGDTSTGIAQRMLATPASFPVGNCNLIWAGGNNPTQVSQILSDVASMINALQSPKCFLVIGDVNHQSAPIGTSTYNSVISTNLSMASLYGNNYLNIRALLVQAYDPSLPMDVANHAIDNTPTSMMAVLPAGTITSGFLDSVSCIFGVSNANSGPSSVTVGAVVIIDFETILINSMSTAYNVTGCVRGYNHTFAASHAANVTYSTIDGIHLGTKGYQFVAQQVANWFQTYPPNFPLNFTTPATYIPGPVISAVAVSGITSTSAVVIWTTDQPSTSRVNYGTSAALGTVSALDPTLVTHHSVTLSGLTPGTTYTYAAVSANSTSVSTTSPLGSFPTTPGPIISSVTATGITTTSATITWTTDQPSSSRVNYGSSPALGTFSTLDATLATSHSVTISGLAPGTTYSYAVISANSASATSTVATFLTTGASGPGPVISNLATYPVDSVSASILWVTDVNATSLVNYGTTSAYGLTSTTASLGFYHAVPLTGLTSGTTYHVKVVTATASGATTTSADYTFTTAGTAPLTFSAVTATGITSTSATITWFTDKPATTQVSYGTTLAYGSPSLLNTGLVTSHSVTLTSLTPGTLYNYVALSTTATVPAGASGSFTFTTPTGTGGGAAPAISALTAIGITSASATITWTTDQASNTQVSYGTTPALGTPSALDSSLVTSHSVTLTGLTPGTTFYYAATSANSAAMSTTSPGFTFATTSVSGPAPVISNLATYPVDNVSGSILWVTDVNATSVVNYGTTSAYGLTAAPSVPLGLYHAVPLTGLSQGTTYHFSVVTANASGVIARSVDSTFTTTGASPLSFIGVTATSITSTSAAITWTTDKASTSQVAFGTTAAYGSVSPLNSALVISHSVTLTGLAPGTAYTYAALSTNTGAPSAASGNFTFSTPSGSGGGGTAPVTSAVNAIGITSAAATITWTTDQPSSSQISYGTTPALGTPTALDSSLVTSHSVTLKGLTPGITYYYAATSANSGSMFTTAPTSTFATTSASGPAPVISNLATYPVDNVSGTILWVTDVNATSVVNYGTTSAYGLTATASVPLGLYHAVPLKGLTQGTTYHYLVVTANASGAIARSADSTFTTTGAPPLSFIGVTATSITSNSAIITWTTDTASTSQVAFGATSAYGSVSPLNSAYVISHSLTLTGLAPGTAYNYAALSTNVAAPSAASGNFTFSTPSGSGGGGTAPVISAVNSTGVTTTTATITWTTDQPSSSQVLYGTTLAFGASSALDSSLGIFHSVTLLGLTPGTNYYYAATSVNSGALSTTSLNFTFTTTSASIPAPAMTNLATYPVSFNTAMILWTTDQNATSVVNYGTTSAYGLTVTVSVPLGLYHAVPLTGLTPGTTYHFSAVTTNASGVTTTSVDSTFTTAGTAPQ